MIEEGARVKLSRKLTDEETAWARVPRASEFVIESVELESESLPRSPDEIPGDFVYVTDRNGGTCWVPLDAVEVVMTAEQMRKRKLPTAAEIAAEIAGDLLTHHDLFELDEVDYSAKDGTFEAYGRTHDGLGLGFSVKITGVWETDL